MKCCFFLAPEWSAVLFLVPEWSAVSSLPMNEVQFLPCPWMKCCFFLAPEWSAVSSLPLNEAEFFLPCHWLLSFSSLSLTTEFFLHCHWLLSFSSLSLTTELFLHCQLFFLVIDCWAFSSLSLTVWISDFWRIYSQANIRLLRLVLTQIYHGTNTLHILSSVLR